MVLSGTLKEFILADVFQLLTQQKITGKLEMFSGTSQGMVAFKDGVIVAAKKEDEYITNKLFYVLTEIKLQPVAKIREIFNSFGDDIKGLCAEIQAQSILTKDEILSFSESLIEDICCSLFQWKTGTYRFSSLRTVDNLIAADVSVPIENIVMEAMRRVDEWNRMIEFISDDLIFVHAEKTSDELDCTPNPIESPNEYIFKKIDGTTLVKDFYKKSCMSQYKVYEALNTLYKSKKIIALSSKISNSVQAALKHQEQKKASPPFFAVISFTITIALVIYLLLGVILRNVLFPQTAINAYLYKINIPAKNAEQNINIAKLYYKAKYGVEPSSLEELRKNFLLSSDDLYYYYLKLKANNKNNAKFNNDMNKKNE